MGIFYPVGYHLNMEYQTRGSNLGCGDDDDDDDNDDNGLMIDLLDDSLALVGKGTIRNMVLAACSTRINHIHIFCGVGFNDERFEQKRSCLGSI